MYFLLNHIYGWFVTSLAFFFFFLWVGWFPALNGGLVLLNLNSDDFIFLQPLALGRSKD